MMPEDMAGIGMTSARTRERMVDALREAGIRDFAVLEAMRAVPRHIFVDEALASRAYENTALPIGPGQTISQPFIVARMTEILLEEGPLDTVLEIGTGSGYQTAVLARLVKRVYSVEGIPRVMVDQLKPGGRMVLPIGSRRQQVLVRVRRTGAGYEREVLDRVSFVPLTGGLG